jgi:hypothetical protein
MAHQTSEILEKQATPRSIGRLMDVDLFPISRSANIELEDDLSTHIQPDLQSSRRDRRFPASSTLSMR